MIRITGYGVIAEKPRVRQLGRIFPCRRAVRLRVTYFEQELSRALWVDFDTFYIVFFSALIALSNALSSPYYCC